MTPLPEILLRLCAEGRVLLGGTDIAMAPTESAFAVHQNLDGSVGAVEWAPPQPVSFRWAELAELGEVIHPPRLPDSGRASAIIYLTDGRLIVSLESQDEHGGLLSAVEFTSR